MNKRLKHAVIVLAHTDPPQLSRLLSSLDNDFFFFIHLDKKMNKNDMTKLKKHESLNVRFFSWCHITWGGISITKTQMRLMKTALSHYNFDYVHLLSGQDYPISDIEDLKNWFEENNGKQFIEYHSLPYDNWENGTYHRFQFYRLNDWFDYSSLHGRKIIDRLTSFQVRHSFLRRIPDQYPKLYGGSNWMSLTGNCAKMLVNPDKKAQKFLSKLRFTFASDEVYFHTVIMNSKFADTVVNNNKRFIMWSGGGVKPLGINDLFNLMKSDSLFARKITSGYSERLLATLPLFNSSRHKFYYNKNLAGKLSFFASIQNIQYIYDFNCGIGLYVRHLRDSGFSAFGFSSKYDDVAISHYIFNGRYKCQLLDMTETFEIERRADISMAFLTETDRYLADCDNYIYSLIANCLRYVILAFIFNKKSYLGNLKSEYTTRLNNLFSSRNFRLNRFASEWFSNINCLDKTTIVFVYEKV